MIHVGDGKHVVVVEGGLCPPPPVKSHSFKHRPKSAPLFERTGGGATQAAMATPGWKAWKSRTRSEIIRTAPPGKVGKPLGHKDGFRKQELEIIRDHIVNTLMNDAEIQSLIASIREDDPVAAYAMGEMIKMAAEPGATRDRFQIVKTLLEFTKSKPATKTEMKVAQQDAWAMMLLEEEKKNSIPALPNGSAD